MGRRRAGVLWAAGLVAVVVGIGPGIVAGAPPAGASGTITGNGSVDEAWLTGATPDDSITLLQNGSPVDDVNGSPAVGTADALGSLIIRNLNPGSGYSWDDITSGQTTAPFAVLAPGADPVTTSSLYTTQTMNPGINYITMRDGIQLAATVRYPYGFTCTTAAPCPTVVEYSGYGTAGPTDPIPWLLNGSSCTTCGDKNLLPDGSTEVGAVLARFEGFATVSLQMRGTGCSGGAYDLFGYPSDYDVYDAVEIVAHQSWVANHKVGMVGISYSGLSQFPSAGTDPPDLAAIAPLSPTDDLFSTGYPGGMFNDGFAASWIAQRIDDAMPAAAYSGGQIVQLQSTPVSNEAQPWTYYEIDAELAASGGSSSACLANQALHLQSESLESLVGAQMVTPGSGTGRDPQLFDRRSMSKWASQINVPVFVSGALEDEQTGPQWPALLTALKTDPNHPKVFANMVNGNHIDSTDPQVLSRWLEFLDIYVAQKVPADPGFLGDYVLGQFTDLAAGTSCTGCAPPLRFTASTTLAKAKAAFQKQTPRVQIFFDSGAGTSTALVTAGPGAPYSTYSAAETSWPPRGKVRKYFFGSGGSLSTTKPTTPGANSFTLDPSVRPPISLALSASSDSVWNASPPWNWTTVPASDAVAYQTAPFATDTTFAGPASVDLWVTSATPVLDFQVTVTEVRPADVPADEEYVTSGFLRSSNTSDNPDSTRLFTDPGYLGAAATALLPTTYTEVKIPVDPIVHTFRAGTELRIVISAPGGDRPSWEFNTLDSGQSASVGFGKIGASALVVNQVNNVVPTATLPGCGTLRGEPCRSYQAESNQ